MAETVYEKYGENLKSILLKSGIGESWFFIGGFRDDAVCIEYIEPEWQVYTGFRGKRKDLSSYENFRDAVYVFIKTLCIDEEKSKKIYDEFMSIMD